MSFTGYEPARPRVAVSDVADKRTRLKILFILGALPAALVALLAPKAIAMPAASAVSLLLATLVALYAYRAGVHYRSRGLTFWDLAGMLAMIGFSAGAVSDPAATLELFGMPATR